MKYPITNNDTVSIFSKILNHSNSNSDLSIIRSDNFSEHAIMRHPCMNDGFIVLLCMRGSANFKLNFKSHNVIKNTLFCITPHTMVELIEQSEDIVLEGFFFSLDLIASMLSIRNHENIITLIKNPTLKIDQSTMDDMYEFYNFIVEQYKKNDPEYRKDIIAALILALQLKIHSIYSKSRFAVNDKHPSNRGEEIVQSLMKLVLTNYNDHRNISFYADKLCLTPKYLSSVVKKTTGNSLLFWINETIVADVKLRLKTSTLTIKQISDELNFSTPSLFGRFFKQRTGMTPLQYRNHG